MAGEDLRDICVRIWLCPTGNKSSLRMSPYCNSILLIDEWWSDDFTKSPLLPLDADLKIIRNGIGALRRIHCSQLLGSLSIPDSKVHGANMGPTWVLSAPDGPHVGPMNLDNRDDNWLPFSRRQHHTLSYRETPHRLPATGHHQDGVANEVARSQPTEEPWMNWGVGSVGQITFKKIGVNTDGFAAKMNWDSSRSPGAPFGQHVSVFCTNNQQFHETTATYVKKDGVSVNMGNPSSSQLHALAKIIG